MSDIKVLPHKNYPISNLVLGSLAKSRSSTSFCPIRVRTGDDKRPIRAFISTPKTLIRNIEKIDDKEGIVELMVSDDETYELLHNIDEHI